MILTVGLSLVLFDAPATSYIDEARRAAELGFDVIELPDHHFVAAPLPTLAAIAVAVPRVQLTNFVLNSSLYQPRLLARDLIALHELSGGRFIVSAGAGYMQEDFKALNVPFGTAGHRVRCLFDLVEAVREATADSMDGAESAPLTLPIRVAGKGDKLLAMAAKHADIVMVDGTLTEKTLAERISFVRDRAEENGNSVRFSGSSGNGVQVRVADIRAGWSCR